ncbi:MAG: sugar transferase [Bacteroidia bacterium]|jgi:undecaprenyl phosphate N,N'-diacetylbacillosamine 1-phosphate transferase|nr:sugar transferase [Bacteroidia bacterium]
MYRRFIKKIVDFVISLVAFVALLPLFFLMICILAVVNRGSVFFTQLRPGLNGKIFRLIKFKTMNDRRDSNGELLPDALRLTTTGAVVRRLSLDELPQLINVLKGDMAIIGPRPLLVDYLPLYNVEQSRRHKVRPGITGWAQVNGRNSISWEERFKLDVWYVDNLTIILDIKIIVNTIIKVFRRQDISSSSSVSMEKFRGSKA